MAKTQQVEENESKLWLLLDDDLKTPVYLNINYYGAPNYAALCIVKATNRQEAIKYLFQVSNKKTIVEPMVIEIKQMDYSPAIIEYP